MPCYVCTIVLACFLIVKFYAPENIETPDFKGYELSIEKGKEELEILVTTDGKITLNEEKEED